MAQLTDSQLLDLFAQYLPDNENELIDPLALRYVLAQLVAAKVSQDVLAQFAQLASPRLTGTPQVPTAPAGTDSDQVASTAFVQAALLAIASGKNLSELVLPQEVREGYWYLTGNGIWEARRNFGAVADPVSGPNWRLLAGFAGQLTTLPVANLSDATDAGRRMLTAPNTDAQRALVNNPKIPAGRYGNHPSFNSEDGPAGAWAWVLKSILALSSAQGVAAPAAPTAGLVDDTGDTFSFLPNPLFPSFAQYKVNGVPGVTGVMVLDSVNSYVQGNRVYVKVVGAVVKGGLAVYVAGSGNVPDGAVLTNADPFTGSVVTPTPQPAAPIFSGFDDTANTVSVSHATLPVSELAYDFNGATGLAVPNNNVISVGNTAGQVTAYARATSTRPEGVRANSQPFTVTAAATDPTVTLSSPQAGQALTVGDPVVLNATPTAGTSPVAKVEFLDNGIKFTETTVAPHTVQKNSTAGAHSFTARVFDMVGAYGLSNAVQISATAASSPPVISGFSPTTQQIGKVVTVFGTGFLSVSQVLVGTAAVTGLSITSDTQLTFTLAAGTVDGYLKVTNANGTATSRQQLVISTIPAPGNIVVDDAANVVLFDVVPGYVSLTNYEYSLNSGASYSAITNAATLSGSRVTLSIGNISKGVGEIQFRVAATATNAAGAAGYNNLAFTQSTLGVKAFENLGMVKADTYPYYGFLDTDYNYSITETWGNGGPAYFNTDNNQAAGAGQYAQSPAPFTGGLVRSNGQYAAISNFVTNVSGTNYYTALTPNIGIETEVLSTFGLPNTNSGDLGRIYAGFFSAPNSQSNFITGRWDATGNGRLDIVVRLNGNEYEYSTGVYVNATHFQFQVGFTHRHIFIRGRNYDTDPAGVYKIYAIVKITDVAILNGWDMTDPNVLARLNYGGVFIDGAQVKTSGNFAIGKTSMGYLRAAGVANFSTVKLSNGQYYSDKNWSLKGGSAAQPGPGDDANDIHNCHSVLFLENRITKELKQRNKIFYEYTDAQNTVTRVVGNNACVLVYSVFTKKWYVLAGNWATFLEPGHVQQQYIYELDALPPEGTVIILKNGIAATVPLSTIDNGAGDVDIFEEADGTVNWGHNARTNPDTSIVSFTLFQYTAPSIYGPWTYKNKSVEDGFIREGFKYINIGSQTLICATHYQDGTISEYAYLYDRDFNLYGRIKLDRISEAPSPGHLCFDLYKNDDGTYSVELLLFDGTEDPANPKRYTWGIPFRLRADGVIVGTGIPQLALPA